MKRTLAALVALFGWAGAACAQDFEEVTIKRAPQGCSALDGEFNQDESGISYHDVRLADVIERAYGLAVEPATGPLSIWARRYDIDAKIPHDAALSQGPAMLRKMLAERFHVAVHEISGEREEYWLLVAKGGLKMHQNVHGRTRRKDDCLTIMPKPGVGVHIEARGYSKTDCAFPELPAERTGRGQDRCRRPIRFHCRVLPSASEFADDRRDGSVGWIRLLGEGAANATGPVSAHPRCDRISARAETGAACDI